MTDELKGNLGEKPEDMVTLPLEVSELRNLKGFSLIRAWREHLGLSREDVALRMGISPAAFAQMEAKKAKPRIITLKKIADALDVKWEQLRD